MKIQKVKVQKGQPAPSNTSVLNGIAERSGLNKKEVAAVLDALAAHIGETICDGETPYIIPGLFKFVPQIKPATEARFGVPNPFRPGETMDVSAKPSRKVVKVRVQKGQPAPSKWTILNGIAERSGLNKKEVAVVLDALAAHIGETIRDGETPYIIPGLLKIVPQIKPATEARFGVPDPFRPGETMDVAAKPERKIVKIHPLKGLKDMLSDSAPATEARFSMPNPFRPGETMDVVLLNRNEN